MKMLNGTAGGRGYFTESAEIMYDWGVYFIEETKIMYGCGYFP